METRLHVRKSFQFNRIFPIDLKSFTGSRTIYVVRFIQLPTRQGQGWIELVEKKSDDNLMIQYYLTEKVMEIYVQPITGY